MSERARCRFCGALVRVTHAGNLASHRYVLTVSRGAIRAVGAARVKRPCPGGGKPPRQ
jgi:hypothetical protein